MKTASKIITVGKHRAIAGLYWTRSAEELSPHHEIKLLAKEIGTRWGTIQRAPDMSWWLGLVAPDQQKAAKDAFSAALWLAESVTQPTIYIEAQDARGTRYWVLAVRPGAIDPSFDAILPEDEAKKLLDRKIGTAIQSREEVRVVVGGQGLAPSSPVIDRSEPERAEFSSLVGPPPKSARIEQIAGIKPATVIGLMTFVGIIAASLIGYQFYQEHQRQKRYEEELARAAAEQARLAELSNITQLRVAEAVRLAAEEETATPSPRLALDACLGMTAVYPPMLGGWRLTTIECDFAAGSARATYARRTSDRRANPTYEDITLAARARGMEAGIDLGQDAASITQTMDLGARRPGRQRDALSPIGDVLTQVPSALQIIENVGENVGVRFEPAQPRPILYRDPENEAAEGAAAFKPVPEDQGFRKGNFTLSGNAFRHAGDAAGSLDHPMVTLTSLRLVSAGMHTYQWSLAGTYIGL